MPCVFMRVTEKEKELIRIRAAKANQLLGKYIIRQGLEMKPIFISFIKSAKRLHDSGVFLNERTHLTHIQKTPFSLRPLLKKLREFQTFVKIINKEVEPIGKKRKNPCSDDE